MSSDSDSREPLTRAARRAAERAAAAAGNPAPAVPQAPVPVPNPEPATDDQAPWLLSELEPEATTALPLSPPASSRPERRIQAAQAQTSGVDTLFSELNEPAAEPAPRPVKRRPRVSFIGVLGELLITAGVLVMLYLVWQLWYNDMVERGQQDSLAASLTEQWDNETGEIPTSELPPGGVPPLIAQPADGVEFANLRIPRFGENYGAPMAGGVSKAKTLDKAGIGHYPDTQLPGQPGNFAVAGHRNTHGAPLNLVADLRLGDAIVVETREGWFTYRFRNTEYVAPTAVDVLNPVPRLDSVEVKDSVITLTSCNPKMSTAERIISYGVFESFTPRSAGAPTSLTPLTEG